MTRKHFLIYGHGGSYNHGGEAITSCTIEFLRKTVPNCFITLSTHFPEQDKEFGIMADEIVTRDTAGQTNAEVYRETLDKITANTTAIQVGGDNYCYANWQRYAQVHSAVKKAGGKSILWGTSIDEKMLDEELLQVLREHDLVLARESITFRALESRGIQNVLSVSDIAFTMQAQEIEFALRDYVIVNASPLVCRKNPKVFNAVQELVNYILKETTLNVALVPHVVVATDNDYDALSNITIMDRDRVVLVSDKLSARQYKSIIAGGRFCVAARTHVTIAAYSSCVPTLAIGYSTKAKGIAKDLGYSDYIVDVEDAKMEEALLCKFKEMVKHESELKEQLKQIIESYKRKALPDEVINLVKGEME